MHQTPQNREMVSSILDFKLATLIQQSDLWLTPKANLLGLQALLLYQIIRIFDGDDRQRANAERNFQPLDTWTAQLHQSYFNPKRDPGNDSPFQN